MRQQYSWQRGIPFVFAVLFLLFVAIGEAPGADGDMVLLPSDRIIGGTVAGIAADQVKVTTADIMPRYLSVRQAQEKGIWPLHIGEHLHIVVNEQNMVLGYHQIGDLGSHQIISGRLAQALMVGQEWAVIQPDGNDRQAYRVRALVRSKLAGIPVGYPAVFLIDETNQIMDTTFGGEETLRAAATGWRGSPPKGVNRQLAVTVVEVLANGKIVIQTKTGEDLIMEVGPFLRDRVAILSVGQRVILMLDDDDKIADVAFSK